MSIITISRGSFSGGKLIAEGLAKDLDFRLIDREVIVEKAAASGVSQTELREAMEKPPTFLERFRHRKYLYLALIQAALTDEVKTGKAVYHGNAGHLLLAGGGPVMRVRIIAPLEYRISMAQQRLKYTRDEAVAYIERMDADRQKWTQYLYGVNWGAPSLYDVVLNLDRIDIQHACDTIAHLVRKQACFDFDAKCQAEMTDLAIASRVKADLALNQATHHLEFDVRCQEGRVSVRGKIPREDMVHEVRAVAEKAAGVQEVVLDELMSTTQA